MLIDTQTGRDWMDIQPSSPDREVLTGTEALRHERQWRQPEQRVSAGSDDITISRWTDPLHASRHLEATTPSNRYFIGIALRATRLKLTDGCQTVFDGIMPEGALYVSAPSRQLRAEFRGPSDFLHFHVSSSYFRVQQLATQFVATAGLNDLVLLRDPFAGQLARALIDQGDVMDERFARCIGQTLAMHLARLEVPRTKVNALPKWRLRRVEEYVRTHFDRSISLFDLARVAGLSRMHFAAQFRAATGYRPREYLLHQRIEHAKSLLSNTQTPLAEVALAVGFCTQAHFSTVFKRITGETPARWRCASKNELPAIQSLPPRPVVMTAPCKMINGVDSRNTPLVPSAMVRL